MKALVIGGNGFIGTALVDQLIERGIKVRVFDRYPSRFKDPVDGVEYITGDFANQGEVHQAVAGSNWVFHLAYTTLPETSNEDPVYDVRSNVIDTIQLLQECCENDVDKFVFVSSGGTVYGVPQSVPIKEEHPTDPICSYGITKLTIEKYLALFHHTKRLEYSVARIANPYGERQNPNARQGAIGVFLGCIARGQPITIYGDGQVVRDFIYIRDAAEGLIACADYVPGPDAPRVFNVGSGQGYSLNQIVDTLKKVVDVEVKVNHIPGRAVDVPSNVLDIELARKLLKWEPKVDLETGVKHAWNWIKSLSLV
ncbi:MAG: NAD-dependent epimerase/dehydratase family protein [Candidatus Obscuribacterales bacterium]|nr:NAD-dependent epimerase/dehydratase family protein [Candidatus Obscuribacterales bacterium]